MKVTPLKIPEVKLIEPDVFEDERGFFYESFNQQKFNEAIGQEITFVQDNHSKSSKGVLRGLHYQDPPYAQGKLIRIVAGEVFDVAVDIRKGSPTYGQWVGETLSAINKKQLWIPEDFAHGFLVLSDEAEIIYKTTEFYSPEHEHCLKYNDKKINITWPSISSQYLLSPKDAKGQSLA
mgnify:FL=1